MALGGLLRETEISTAAPIAWAESWRVALVADVAPNDSDKTFTVPANTEWQVLWIYIILATSADVGARQLEIEIQNAAAAVIGRFQVGVTQAANLTYNYLVAQAMPDLTALRDVVYLLTPLPAGLFLSAGQKVRIYDNNAVAVAADDMSIQLQYAFRPV
jgi:hypothetical protein